MVARQLSPRQGSLTRIGSVFTPGDRLEDQEIPSVSVLAHPNRSIGYYIPMMAKKTDVLLLHSFLKNRLDQRASKKVLLAHFSGARNWTAEKVDHVVAKAVAESNSVVSIGKGGVVKYMGSEKHGNSPVYSDAAHALEAFWSKKKHLKESHAVITAHVGQKGQFDWSHPDVVLRGKTQKKKSFEGWHCHAFEIEKVGGFSMASIFQAYVQGRGADFAWVLYSRGDVQPEYLARVVWAARRVGVGLISYGKPGSITTWKEELPAKYQNPSVIAHESFINSAFGKLGHY